MQTQYEAVIHKGRIMSFCLPAVMYHGTSRGCISAVETEGLRPDIPDKQSRLSSDAVYLISDPTMAAHMARSRATRRNEEPVVLAIDASALDPDQIFFDLNMSGNGWTESIAYGDVIPAAAVRALPAEAAKAEAGLMLFDPVPGKKPLVFELAWPRAAEFLAQANVKLLAA